MSTKRHFFHVHGMHCNACVLTIESTLGELPQITSVTSRLRNHSLEIVGDFGEKTPEEIAQELTRSLVSLGYTISLEKTAVKRNFSDFKVAIPVALTFVAFFVILQKMGIVNLVNAGSVTYGTAFIIGIVASLSTCMAVVGGLVLSMSAAFAKQGEKLKPSLMFHGGRVVSFFVLGGVIGALGSAFTLNTSSAFVLSFIIGIVMLILGINLLDTFHFAKKFQPSMPKFIGTYAHGLAKYTHSLTPLLVGIATFFLPCGFTQSMQLYTLSTGSFLRGGLTMLAFVLGTLPVLSLMSFSSFSVQKSSKAGIFFKSAGLIVILFALFNIINSLVVIGLIPPVFNF